ncbi:MAG TPA: hypothetical protein VII46_04655, partial [Acidimicrobiales bacterium]
MAPELTRSSGRRARPSPPDVPPPDGPDRLLAGVGADGRAVTLRDHVTQWGALPAWPGSSFLDELERSGLRGQGGAWFPLAAKWRSLRPTRLKGPVVVANGAEGEPASGKDRLL